MADGNVRPLPRRRRPARAMSVAMAARRGDEYELLLALRDRLAQAIGECQSRDLAPLSRRLLEVTKELAEVEALAVQAAEDSSGSGEPWDPSTI